MRKFNSKVKKKARKPLHSRTRGHPPLNDESNMTIPESSIRNARIKSAIENGSRISLPSDTKGLNLSKFEHVGKEGPLVVYAEDKKMFNEFGHFTVITSFRPSDSLRNQLFFASRQGSDPLNQKKFTEPTDLNKDVQTKDVIRYGKASLPNKTLSHPKNNSAQAKQTRRQPNFEELVKRYKDRQEKYFHLLGDESLYLFQKIDRMCKAGKKEVDINFPMQDDPQKKIVETTEDKIYLPKLTVQKPGVKKVQIELPQQSSQVVFKDKTESILPSI